jgi:hypothetical protein
VFISNHLDSFLTLLVNNCDLVELVKEGPGPCPHLTTFHPSLTLFLFL